MKCCECERETPPAQVGYYRLHENNCMCASCLETERSKFKSGEPAKGSKSPAEGSSTPKE